MTTQNVENQNMTTHQCEQASAIVVPVYASDKVMTELFLIQNEDEQTVFVGDVQESAINGVSYIFAERIMGDDKMFDEFISSVIEQKRTTAAYLLIPKKMLRKCPKVSRRGFLPTELHKDFVCMKMK